AHRRVVPDLRRHRRLGVERPAPRRLRARGAGAVRAARRDRGAARPPGVRGGTMSDFVSSGWAFYVAIATLVSIAGCAVLLYALGRMRVQRPDASAKTPTTGHVWDGDLAEYNNPLPRW